MKRTVFLQSAAAGSPACSCFLWSPSVLQSFSFCSEEGIGKFCCLPWLPGLSYKLLYSVWGHDVWGYHMSANPSAIKQGLEAVWTKALDYVTGEPYRSRIAAQLAQLRFHLAVSKDHMTTQQALAKLAQARSISRGTISPLAYAAGWLTIVLPGGTRLASARWLQPFRSRLSRFLGYDSRPQ